MSEIVIAGNTSGSVTIAAPDVAGTTTLTLPASTGTLATTADIPAGGKILQVLQTVKTDTFSTSSNSWVDWTGMSVTITPTSATSKFYITLTSGVSNDTANSFQYVKLQRNGTDIALGDTVSSVTRCWIDAALQNSSGYDILLKPLSGSFLDSPATSSAITYKVQVIRTANGIAYFGRTASIQDVNRSSIPSVLTLMEVAG